jgi:hypothetical protein
MNPDQMINFLRKNGQDAMADSLQTLYDFKRKEEFFRDIQKPLSHILMALIFTLKWITIGVLIHVGWGLK